MFRLSCALFLHKHNLMDDNVSFTMIIQNDGKFEIHRYAFKSDTFYLLKIANVSIEYKSKFEPLICPFFNIGCLRSIKDAAINFHTSTYR